MLEHISYDMSTQKYVLRKSDFESPSSDYQFGGGWKINPETKDNWQDKWQVNLIEPNPQPGFESSAWPDWFMELFDDWYWQDRPQQDTCVHYEAMDLNTKLWRIETEYLVDEDYYYLLAYTFFGRNRWIHSMVPHEDNLKWPDIQYDYGLQNSTPCWWKWDTFDEFMKIDFKQYDTAHKQFSFKTKDEYLEFRDSLDVSALTETFNHDVRQYFFIRGKKNQNIGSCEGERCYMIMKDDIEFKVLPELTNYPGSETPHRPDSGNSHIKWLQYKLAWGLDGTVRVFATGKESMYKSRLINDQNEYMNKYYANDRNKYIYNMVLKIDQRKENLEAEVLHLDAGFPVEIYSKDSDTPTKQMIAFYRINALTQVTNKMQFSGTFKYKPNNQKIQIGENPTVLLYGEVATNPCKKKIEVGEESFVEDYEYCGQKNLWFDTDNKFDLFNTVYGYDDNDGRVWGTGLYYLVEGPSGNYTVSGGDFNLKDTSGVEECVMSKEMSDAITIDELDIDHPLKGSSDYYKDQGQCLRPWNALINSTTSDYKRQPTIDLYSDNQTMNQSRTLWTVHNAGIPQWHSLPGFFFIPETPEVIEDNGVIKRTSQNFYIAQVNSGGQAWRVNLTTRHSTALNGAELALSNDSSSSWQEVDLFETEHRVGAYWPFYDSIQSMGHFLDRTYDNIIKDDFAAVVSSVGDQHRHSILNKSAATQPDLSLSIRGVRLLPDTVDMCPGYQAYAKQFNDRMHYICKDVCSLPKGPSAIALHTVSTKYFGRNDRSILYSTHMTVEMVAQTNSMQMYYDVEKIRNEFTGEDADVLYDDWNIFPLNLGYSINETGKWVLGPKAGSNETNSKNVMETVHQEGNSFVSRVSDNRNMHSSEEPSSFLNVETSTLLANHHSVHLNQLMLATGGRLWIPDLANYDHEILDPYEEAEPDKNWSGRIKDPRYDFNIIIQRPSQMYDLNCTLKASGVDSGNCESRCGKIQDQGFRGAGKGIPFRNNKAIHYNAKQCTPLTTSFVIDNPSNQDFDHEKYWYSWKSDTMMGRYNSRCLASEPQNSGFGPDEPLFGDTFNSDIVSCNFLTGDGNYPYLGSQCNTRLNQTNRLNDWPRPQSEYATMFNKDHRIFSHQFNRTVELTHVKFMYGRQMRDPDNLFGCPNIELPCNSMRSAIHIGEVETLSFVWEEDDMALLNTWRWDDGNGIDHFINVHPMQYGIQDVNMYNQSYHNDLGWVYLNMEQAVNTTTSTSSTTPTPPPTVSYLSVPYETLDPWLSTATTTFQMLSTATTQMLSTITTSTTSTTTIPDKFPAYRPIPKAVEQIGAVGIIRDEAEGPIGPVIVASAAAVGLAVMIGGLASIMNTPNAIKEPFEIEPVRTIHVDD